MKVRRFFLRLLPRLGIFVLSVLLLSVLTFYISRLAPGDPLVSYYGDRVEKMSPAEREWAEDKLGLNDPLPTQYARWFSRALHGDFGISYKYKIDVLELIGDRIGNTLLLGGLGFVLLFVLALLLARSEGMGRAHIVLLQCLRNVLPSYLSLMAISVPHVMGGTYIVEAVFSYPGLGTLSYESARYKDYNLLMVLCLLSGAVVIACSLLAQALNARLDPRLRPAEREVTSK